MPFDTISARPVRVLHRHPDHRPVSPAPWKMTTGVENFGNQLTATTTYHTYPPDRLIRVRSEGDMIKSVEVNLSRLLHGHHGGLIKNDAEVAEAWRRLEAALDEISFVPSPVPRWTPYRIDVGWNFESEFAAFTAPLMSAKHPWVRRTPFLIDRTTLWWKGCSRGFQLRVYDKSKMMRCRDRNVVRVELQYGRDQIVKTLGADYTFARPTWDLGAQLLRNGLHVMPTHAVYAGALGIAELLAILDLHNTHPLGERTFDAWARHHSRATVYRTRRKMDAFAMTCSGFNWRSWVPETSWPPAVELISSSPAVVIALPQPVLVPPALIAS